jgi:hypothetical protein
VDPTQIIDAIPGTPEQKAKIAALAALVYGAALVARRFAAPHTIVGKWARLLVDGWKHPSERAAPPSPDGGG